MRVTNNMISGLVSFNMQRSLTRFMELQGQMSSGRRINRASDDPLGTLRDLDYRKELATIDQMRSNVSQGLTWVNNYDTIVANISDLINDAHELAVSMANGTYDDQARAASADEIKSIYQQIMQISQSQREGKRLFSGYKTDINPLIESAYGVRYIGDDGLIEFQIDSSSRMGVNINGNTLFLKQVQTLGAEADLDPGISLMTEISDLNGGEGIDLTTGMIRIVDENLGINVDVDISGATYVADIINSVNAALAANVPPITNLTMTLGNQFNNLMLEATPGGQISPATPLGNLNGGDGIDLTDGRILVSDGAGININVDLTGSKTIDDILKRFNSTLQANPLVNNVTMQINAAGTGLQIVDANGTPQNLSIGEASKSSTLAADLGIFGDINPTLNGSDLDPVSAFKVEELGGTTANDLGIAGSFNDVLNGGDLNRIVAADALLSELNGGLGFELGEIQIRHGDRYKNVDLGDPTLLTVQDLLDRINSSGLDITASINPDGTGLQVVNNDPNRSLMITEVDEGRTAKSLGIFGAADMMAGLMLFEESLRNDDQKGIELMIETMDRSLQHLLNQRASVGAKGIRLESTDNRLADNELSFTRLLSEVEDADISKLVTDLATYENNYQASLIASAKIIQPSLLDFLS